MGRVRIFIVLALAVTAGAVFAFGTYNYVQKVSTPGPVGPGMATQPVVVAVNDLDVGAEIKPEDVKVIRWPKDSVPAQAMSDPKDAIGRGVITPLIQNEPLLPSKLS
jgi:Flp pilus assembly protein CpaB